MICGKLSLYFCTILVMRKGEVQALTWNDINFNTNEIIVNKTLSVKTKNSNYKITSTKNYLNRRIKMSKNFERNSITI